METFNDHLDTKYLNIIQITIENKPHTLEYRRQTCYIYNNAILTNAYNESIMKKLLIGTTLLLSLTANAEFIGEGGTTEVTTIKNAIELRDDSRVIVEGHIVKQLKNELYLFKDATGEVEMEIDDEDFRNIKISADDKVRITAEVDSDWTTTSLEAEYVELAK